MGTAGRGAGRRRSGGTPRIGRGRAGWRPQLCLTFPSDTGYLSLVRDLTKKLAEGAGFDAVTADGMALAVLEATTNVVQHAYRGAANGAIELRVGASGSDFRVELLDTGATVDPRRIPRVDLERYVAERKKGGLGVYLMGRIMDSVTFRRSARRNVCCLVKRKAVAGGDHA